ncbi:MAG: hypothetical protein QHD01_26350 [Bradyrhizobium sp.]|uniref:hypothetical protein n=1 Tax=Bradyrhizobium sp. TaxID=376 RepID=UPI0029A4122C|nr:hypothetical protein [Bradyrhizobium sp.]MDX3970100.1 hypothetical protein [Bradyrhizobium sp.]
MHRHFLVVLEPVVFCIFCPGALSERPGPAEAGTSDFACRPLRFTIGITWQSAAGFHDGLKIESVGARDEMLSFTVRSGGSGVRSKRDQIGMNRHRVLGVD